MDAHSQRVTAAYKVIAEQHVQAAGDESIDRVTGFLFYAKGVLLVESESPTSSAYLEALSTP
jgi:hypothetical protein